MKVYIVIDQPSYEPGNIMAVFSKEEDAKACVQKVGGFDLEIGEFELDDPLFMRWLGGEGLLRYEVLLPSGRELDEIGLLRGEWGSMTMITPLNQPRVESELWDADPPQYEGYLSMKIYAINMEQALQLGKAEAKQKYGLDI